MSMLIDAYRFGGGGGGGGTPTLLSVTQSAFNSNTTSHAVQMPATVNAGDLLVVGVMIAAETYPIAASGFTSIGSSGRATSIKVQYFYKIAAGTEGGTTVDFSTSPSAIRMVAQVHRIQSGTFHASTAPQGQFDNGNSNTPNPPNLSPSWGSASTLWLIGTGVTGASSVSSFPTANNNNSQAGTGGALRVIASCTDATVAASLDPGTFGIASSLDWVAATIGIRPA